MGAKRRQFGRGYDRSRWATNPPPAHLYAYGGSWPVIRKEVLERDRFECQLRFPVICFGRATQVDHIVRPEEGGTNDLANLRAVCKPCHARRTGQQGALAKQRRAQRKDPQ